MKKSMIEIESALEVSGQLIATHRKQGVSLDGKARDIVMTARNQAREFGLSSMMISSIELEAGKAVRS